MENWVYLYAYTLPNEAHLARVKLESEGIKVHLKDELTIQANPLYSEAIGGVKLFVQKEDLERAKAILISIDMMPEDPKEPNQLIAKFDKKTSKLPFLKNLSVELRMLFLLAVALIGISIPFIIQKMPSLEEQLEEHEWCVVDYYFKEKRIPLNTIEGPKVYFSGCKEQIDFAQRTLKLPGFNTRPLYAKWKLENGQIIIYEVDTLAHYYLGEYDFEINEKKLVLKSDKAMIYCRKKKINNPIHQLQKRY